MSTPGPAVRLIGGPPSLDGTVHRLEAPAATPGRSSRPPTSRRSTPSSPTGAAPERLLFAVRGTRACPLDELVASCNDRGSAARVAASWRVAVYAPFGRPRRMRLGLYRFEGTFVLEPDRDDRGGWTLRPGARSARSISSTTDGVAGAGTSGAASPGASSAAEHEGTELVWSLLEDGIDLAAGRCRRVASLLPDGPLAERAGDELRAVDRCVADAARLCAVGATVARDWRPGAADDQAAALVARITALVGTIDQVTVELVRLHLEISDGADELDPGGAVPPADTIALLGAAVAELARPQPPHQRGDQDDVRNNLDSH